MSSTPSGREDILSGQDSANPASDATKPTGRRLARPLDVERQYDPDAEAMLAAIRVVLAIPRVIPDAGGDS